MLSKTMCLIDTLARRKFFLFVTCSHLVMARIGFQLLDDLSYFTCVRR